MRALDSFCLPDSDPGSLLKNMIMPDISYPWGCTNFLHRAKTIDPLLIIQRQLGKVQLNIPSKNYADMYRVDLPNWTTLG